jgi:hypothetical protein
MCIQQSQGGYIEKAKHALLILPAALRAKALSMRRVQSFNKLWAGTSRSSMPPSASRCRAGTWSTSSIASRRSSTASWPSSSSSRGRSGRSSSSAARSPASSAPPRPTFWKALWTPLVRICYGSLALKVAELRKTPPPTRVPLTVRDRSFAGLRDALADAQRKEEEAMDACLSQARAVASRPRCAPTRARRRRPHHLRQHPARRAGGDGEQGGSLRLALRGGVNPKRSSRGSSSTLPRELFLFTPLPAPPAPSRAR